MSGFTAYTCETVTGKVIARLDGDPANWRRELNGLDTAELVLGPGAVTPATRDWLRLITTPARTCLLIDYSGTLIWGGPIWVRDWDGTALHLRATGVRSILTRRKAISSFTAPYITQLLQYTGLSLSAIAIRLVEVATAAAKSGAPLPLVLPADTETDSDPTHARSYYGFELGNVSDLIDDLTAVAGGPDTDFVPSWVDSSHAQAQWTMRVGTRTAPLLTGGPWSWDQSTPLSPVQELTYSEDATNLVTRQWGKGAGTDLDTLIGTASSGALIAAGYPLLEAEADYTAATTQGVLDGFVAGDLAAFGAPQIVWGVQVDGTSSPVLGQYALGDTAMLRVKDHPWIPDSPLAGYSTRIVALEGAANPTVTVEVQ